MTEDTQDTAAPATEIVDAPEAAPVEAPAVEAAPEAEAPAEVPAEAAADATTDGDAPPAPVLDEDGNPIPVSDEPIEMGAVIFVTVQRITPYGAFVALSDGRSGLIHISEIDRNYVKDVREHLREGDRVEAKVQSIKEDGKIDLSIKALQDPQPRVRRGADPEFEQKLRKFMRSSEERQVDVKRSVMKKRK